MFQGDEHDPQGQEAVVHLKVELERQEQEHGVERQLLYSACCALAEFPSIWHDQLGLLDLVAR